VLKANHAQMDGIASNAAKKRLSQLRASRKLLLYNPHISTHRPVRLLM